MRETMDNFLNSFLSSSWSDMNESANRSWAGSITSQTDSLLSDSIQTFQVDGKNSAMPLLPSSRMMGHVPAEDLTTTHENTSSIFSNGSLKYGINKGLFLAGNLSQNQQPNHNLQPSRAIEASEGSFSIPDAVACNSTGLPYALELNSSLPHSTLSISSSLESSGSEPPPFGQSIGEAHSISSVPAIWPSSYSDISSLSGQQKVENFSFQGMAKGADLLSKNQNEFSSNFVAFASGQQRKMTSSNSPPHNQGTTDAMSRQLPPFSNGSQMPFSKSTGLHSNSQPEGAAFKHQLGHSNVHQQMTQSNAIGCNIASKPRVRARRGQATDPHSIAERLRREKIAERMKNLQDLVPNSNKTDKASMLDEIIDYVKFLQLQVKVLSMSRLGAAGAVVPLITDAQGEDAGSLHLSPIGQGVDLLESQDNLAFEQEVVKLMESSVTTAMQYLQNKGLCLMPIALATAISNQKGSTAPPERKNERNDCGDTAIRCSSTIVKQEEVAKSMGNGR